ncbi:MAG: hypothetical protein ACI9R3_006507, partial [Verrucomicrobiales bacterium]
MSGAVESIELQILPHGGLTVRPYSGEKRWIAEIVSRFEGDPSAGLVALASASVPAQITPAVMFWRDIASEFLRALCHVSETELLTQDSIELPSAAQLAEWVLSAPPMPGAEYVSSEMLSALWRGLTDWALAEVEKCGDVSSLLSIHAPQWSRVGRVTLHLAENKGDTEYPFAFMATYAAGMTRDGRLRRLPLGGALKEYAGARKKPELLKLLAPLHRAAEQSALIADLVETGDVFHPLVWTPAEAHAFLKEIPVYEECGLFAQLPNWWRKRSRPRVNVTLDSAKHGCVGTDALLDFRMALALGDQELTSSEAKALLEGSEGLVLLRGEWVEVDSERLQEALAHWERVQSEVGEGGFSFVEGMRLLAGTSADLKVDQALDEHASWSLVQAGDQLRETLAGLRAPSQLNGEPPEGLMGTLRDYQLSGMHWLWLCSQLGVGACLADDMGLGKTIQVLAVLLKYQQQPTASSSEKSPALLVLPASLIGNWKAEAERFAPSLNVLVVHRS